MPLLSIPNKPRLHLALYSRPKHPDEPHYALLVTRKFSHADCQRTISAVKFHVKNTILRGPDGYISQPWRFEHVDIADLAQESRLLVCVTIGKVRSLEKAQGAFSRIAVPPEADQDSREDGVFDCRTWVRDALETLRLSDSSDAVSGLREWTAVEQQTKEYLARKKQEGRWNASSSTMGTGLVPWFDLLTGQEIFS
ncbi:hypothetical protein ASPZODRAFT_140007 [Penicilliopsis zonata CBS 506.65]|uniref:Uncharacterized protein n=1 Tax=Penicilliopsis zonata CBS 506.65 TaxID=1073090 RepID=A0A1L9SPA0_9EURO|nr:hypothetical protein ASPZODRAFT_140007 [Penicilliopsis zonata CBS 506.65]OJJ49065.1 hypothetical protein ASPZODRAFT_140007 [Penicilliopsis zonata CBS 506.65]